MSITFAYPTIASPTTSVVVDDIEGFPHTRPWRLFQSAFDTDAATQVVYDHGDPYQAIPLTLFPLTTTEKNSLIKFFKNTTQGRALSFEIQDTAGDIYPVNFAQDVLDPMQVNAGIWSFNIVLRVVSRVNQYLLYMPLENSLALAAGSGVATFTRATIGTYRQDGLIKTAAINVPRFEENGLLMEGGSTSLVTYSEQLDMWSKLRATISANATTAPDGELTGDKIIEDGTANNTHLIYQSYAGFTSGVEYTFSFFVKDAGDNRGIRIELPGAVFPANSNILFYPADGSVFSVGAGLDRYKTTLIGSGWYRLEVTSTASSTAAANVALYMLDGAGNYVYSGDGASGLYVWGGMLEAMSFATSYIKTEAATTSRTTDFCSVQFSGNHPSIQRGNPFTYIVDIDSVSANSVARGIISAGYAEVGVDDFSFLQVNNASVNVSYYRSNLTVDYSGADLDTLSRYGVTVDSNELVSTFLNGSFIEAETHALFDNTGNNAAVIGIGCRATGGTALYGHIKNLRIYDIALHKAEMSTA